MLFDITALQGLAMLSSLAGPSTLGTARPAAQDAVVRSGEFSRIDRHHWAAGTAEIRRTEEGNLILTFSDSFEASPGPDLRVVLSTHASPRTGGDLGDYIELQLLTVSEGAQTFAIPAGVDPKAVGSVVIYCKRYDVLFSVASLTSPGGNSDTSS